MNDKWLDFAIRIQSIAQAGLQYGKDPYDRERYEELRNIAAEIMAEKTDLPVDSVKHRKRSPGRDRLHGSRQAAHRRAGLEKAQCRKLCLWHYKNFCSVQLYFTPQSQQFGQDRSVCHPSAKVCGHTDRSFSLYLVPSHSFRPLFSHPGGKM